MKNNLVWIDLEMTGLDPVNDKILEIATVVTDSALNIVAQGPVITVSQPHEVLEKMNEWCIKTFQKNGLYQRVIDSQITEMQAQEETLNFLRQYCLQGKSPLCGNSVWMDRFFILHHMPDLYTFLHYRTIDVSSIKEIVKRWYPKNPALGFKKQNAHRASDDILESINELKHYKNCFFIANKGDLV